MTLDYQEHASKPAHERAVMIDGKFAEPAPGNLLWGSDEAPPPIGARITATINRCGAAIVTGYFSQDRFLGILCELLDAPEWHRKQNNNNPAGHLFGPEFKSDNRPATYDELAQCKTRAARDLADRMVNDMARKIVGEDVRYCASSLVYTLMQREWDGSEGFDPDDLITLGSRQPDADDYSDSDEIYVSTGGKWAQAYDVESGDDGYRWTELEPIILDGEPAEKGDWYDTALEAWEELFDAKSFDQPQRSECLEHWLVTSWLADKLRSHGETVVDDVAGLTIWGRCTSGQAIYVDHVLQEIARGVLAA